MSVSKEILIIGSGPVGTFLASNLANNHGNHVTICETNESRRKQISATNISSKHNDGSGKTSHDSNKFTVIDSLDSIAGASPSVIIIATKDYHINDAMIAGINSLHKDGPPPHIIFTQSGLPSIIYDKFTFPCHAMIINAGISIDESGCAVVKQSQEKIAKNGFPTSPVDSKTTETPHDVLSAFNLPDVIKSPSPDTSLDKEMYKKAMVRLTYSLLTVPDSFLKGFTLSMDQVQDPDGHIKRDLKPLMAKLKAEIQAIADALDHGELYSDEALAVRVAPLAGHTNSTVKDAALGNRIEMGMLDKLIDDAKSKNIPIPGLNGLKEVFNLINEKKEHQVKIQWDSLVVTESKIMSKL